MSEKMFKLPRKFELILLSIFTLFFSPLIVQSAHAEAECTPSLLGDTVMSPLSAYLTVTNDEVIWKDLDQEVGTQIPLANHQLRMLFVMFKHMDEVLTYAQIYDSAWPLSKFTSPEDKKQSVRKNINQIRAMFRLVVPNFSSITTIIDQGYLLRSRFAAAQDFVLDDLRVTPTNVYWKGQEVGKGRLSRDGKARQLLLLLTSRVGTDVSYEEIMETVWPEYIERGFDKSENPLLKVVDQLRVAFKKIDPSFNRIRNARSTGYAWTVTPNSIFIKYAGFEYNESTNRFRRHGREFRLMPVEARLFLMLLRAFPNVAPTDSLLPELNPSLGAGKLSKTANVSLRVYMSALRSSLLKIDEAYGEIKGSNLEGYVLIGE